MWKEYSKSYIGKNLASGISIRIAVFIAALFISLVSATFYNMWTDSITRITAKEGEWQGRLTGELDYRDLTAAKSHENVKSAELKGQDGVQSSIEFTFYNPRRIYKDLQEIRKLAAPDKLETVEAEYHNSLLTQYYIYSPEEKRDPPLLLTFYITVLALVCMSLILIISHAFGISMDARVHQMGILQSVGATPKQIRTALIQEALALSIPPALCGIAAGAWMTDRMIAWANLIGEDAQRVDAVFTYHPLIFVVTAAACLVTVYAAAGKAAVRLSRMSPLEAIRGGTEQQTSDGMRSFPLLSFLFGIEGELAGKSLYIRRKAFRTSNLALALSFLVFGVFLNFMTLSDISTQQTYFERYKNAWDLMAAVRQDGGEEPHILSKIKAVPEVRDCTAYRKADAYTWIEEAALSEEVKALGGLEAFKNTGISEKNGRYKVKTPIIVLDDAGFLLYCEENGIALNPDDGPCSVTVNRIWENIHSDFRDRKFIPFIEEGKESLNLFQTENGDDTPWQQEAGGNTPWQPEAISFSDQVPDLREEYDYFSLLQVMPESSFNTMTGFDSGNESYYRILVSSDTAIEAVQRSLETILDGSGAEYTVENRIAEKEYDVTIRRGLNIIMGGISGMLALIGVASVFANTLGGMAQRRREFARYLSIGMTPGGVWKVLMMEALIVGIRPVLLLIPLNMLFVIFAIYEKYDSFVKMMPVKPLILMSVLVLCSVGLAYCIAGRKLTRQDFVEALKDDTMI